MDNRDINRVAYHEAGHAVAARVLGVRVDQVSITPDGGLAETGALDFKGGYEPPPEDMRNDLRIFLAGYAAELVAGFGFAFTAPEYEADRDGVFDRVLHLWGAGDHAERVERELEAASAMLREHWSGVERVAAELERVRTIDGDRLDELLALQDDG